jgi:hypothetical protein
MVSPQMSHLGEKKQHEGIIIAGADEAGGIGQFVQGSRMGLDADIALKGCRV